MNGQFNIQVFQRAEQQQNEDFNNAEPPQNEDDQQEPHHNGFTAEAIIEAGDDATMHTLSNFTCLEFERLFNVVSFQLRAFHEGGRISQFSTATQFLITLSYLKSAMLFHDLTENFGVSVSYLSSLISEKVRICAPILERWAIRWISYQEDVAKHTLFSYFPNCVCAVDASVQEIPRPRSDQKKYYSGKHRYHCLKMQVAVAPNGLAISVNGPYPGSYHDFKIFQNSDTRYQINYENQIYQNQHLGEPNVSALFEKVILVLIVSL